MNSDIKIEKVPIEKLRPHEEFTEGRLQNLLNYFGKKPILWFPILVDEKDFIILDGHHRTEAFKRMGLKTILARLVDYDSSEIKLIGRRSEIPVTKDIIRKKALADEVFPHKTTKHIYPNHTKHFDVPLSEFD
jgi:hypothetical protein